MKILFLDIDGVLNNETTKEKSSTGFRGLDRRLVTLFKNWLRHQEDLYVVLSSTWRQDPIMVEEIKDIGIPHIGMTGVIHNPGSRHIIRGEEVSDWLREHPEISTYAIIDDKQDFFHDQLPYFVQTSYVHGLRPKDLIKLEKILKG